MRNKIVALCLTLSCILNCACFAISLEEAQGQAYNATCRVNTNNSIGTGVVIGFDSSIDKYLVLTNYHVVTNNSSAICDFWINGKIASCNGTVVWRYFDNSIPADFCLLAIDPNFVKQNNVKNVPIAGPEVISINDAFFVSAGCPKGVHVGSWKGVVTKNGESVEFEPAPYPGQSGSGVFKIVDDKLWVAGIITWRVGQEGYAKAKGAYIPIRNLYKALNVIKYQTGYEVNKDPWVAPDNYIEINNSSSYRVVEITTQGCSSCVKALGDVNKLIDYGIDVSSIDVADCDEAMIKKYQADKFPTFALVDPNGCVKKVWYGYGYGDEIISTINSLYEVPEFTSNIEDLSCIQSESLETYNVEENTAEDFRTRAAVVEDYEGVNFFDDSRKAWNLRNKKQEDAQSSFKNTGTKNCQSESDRRESGILANRIGNELELRFKKIGDSAEDRVNKILTKEKNEASSFVFKIIHKALFASIFVVMAEVFFIMIFSKLVKSAFSSVVVFIANKISDKGEK